jgi:HSP20 family protein
MTDKDIEIKTDEENIEKEDESKPIPSESVLSDIITSIREKQEDLGKSLSDYSKSLQKPLADIIETDDALTVVTDLPGVKKEDVEVNISEDSLDIVAKFDDEITDEGTNYIKRERSYGETTRTIALPEKINIKKASAKFKDSVLTVELPKIKEEKHKVNIE